MISDNEIEQIRIRLLNATKGPGRYLFTFVEFYSDGGIRIGHMLHDLSFFVGIGCGPEAHVFRG